MRLIIIISSLLAILFTGCQSRNDLEQTVKVLSIITTDSINEYNKGFALGDYFEYDFKSDSLTLRIVQKRDPFEFINFKGKLKNSSYTDSIRIMFSKLNKRVINTEDSVKHCYQPNCYCNGVSYYLIAREPSNENIIPSNSLNEDRLSEFVEFYYRLKDSKWNRKVISDTEIDGTGEVVRTLKGLGIYDSIIKRYAPLPCRTGIEMDKLYGVWRTIGDQYNDPTFKYWTNTIEKNGNWTMVHYVDGKPIPKFFARIVSINENQINLKSVHGPTYCKVINLTENCLEYEAGSGQIWRFDRQQ